MSQDSRNISKLSFNTPRIEKAEGTTFLLGNHFLKKHKQVQAGKKDRLYVAQTQDHKIVGAFWFDVQPTHYWIRNLFVDPNYRHQGIGTKLIQQALKEVGSSSCYCFNAPSLAHFYQSIGFTEILANDLPNILQTRLLRYQEKGKNFIAMRFTES